MKNGVRRSIIIIGVLTLMACAGGNKAVAPDDIGYGYGRPQKERNYVDVLNRILNMSDIYFNIGILCTVTYDRDMYDIFQITYNENQRDTKKILLIGSIHGDEPAGVEALLRLLETIESNPTKFEKYSITVIPLLNPWGWEYNKRTNAKGLDLNLDFGLFQSQEIQALAHHVASKKFDLVIDLHEAGQKDHFVYCYGPETEERCKTFSRIFKQKGYKLDTTYKDILSATQDGVMSVPMWMINLSKFTDSIALPHYFYLLGDRAVVTMEASNTYDFQSQVIFHLDAILFFLTN